MRWVSAFRANTPMRLDTWFSTNPIQPRNFSAVDLSSVDASRHRPLLLNKLSEFSPRVPAPSKPRGNPFQETQCFKGSKAHIMFAASSTQAVYRNAVKHRGKWYTGAVVLKDRHHQRRVPAWPGSGLQAVMWLERFTSGLSGDWRYVYLSP